MKGKKIQFTWIAQPHGTKQSDQGVILDVILVGGNTKYLVKNIHGNIHEIFPSQITEST